ncbi:MAG: DNA polymerase/3'-5' exonuclease PolX [Thaumarchaeota archaeon]|nr:DNA polymerase/3'-5' exonuclease PolX [Nitrososphaerota archaeon]
MAAQISNYEAAASFYELAFYMDLEDDPFRGRAYERAARAIESSPQSIIALYKKGGVDELQTLPGVGKAIAKKLQDLFKTGRIPTLEKLQAKYPIKLSELLSVEGLGPRRIKTLYEKLSVKNLEDLETAAKTGKVRQLTGFGEKTEEKILQSLEFLKAEKGRIPLAIAIPLADQFQHALASVEGVEEVYVAGSIRRGRETIGDIDLLAITSNPRQVIDTFTSLPQVVAVHQKGEVKASIRHKSGIDADLRVIQKGSMGAALMYFTGSKEHNVALRTIALSKGMHLNEYGLFKKEKKTAGEQEEEVYKTLGLPYIPPELRENRGEIEAASKNSLPHLVELTDLKGDLQVQTSWTDGANSITEMVQAAKTFGLEYIAITDHTKSLAMTGGLNEEKLRTQMKEIDKLNQQSDGFRILKSAEVNILKDGSLDIDDQTLGDLDAVGAAVHTNFNLPREEMTRRIIRAIENPNVDILFHPTGRLIGQRPPYQVDIESVIEAAKRTDTILEIDAYPERLDLKDEHARMAVDRGVNLCIDSDAHSKEQFPYLQYGVTQARRGWAAKESIVNTRSVDEFLRYVKH